MSDAVIMGIVTAITTIALALISAMRPHYRNRLTAAGMRNGIGKRAGQLPTPPLETD